ncbi:serine protease inhibitor A3C-like [Onychomys torridus]|uniref:serine protease inhibitor A3C-like n=1 Tax=Onychomys torridus TaxID=38674 RepID=UPI00167F2910|nr:serine protease inhibitor A3C-like [Onychomys torridus]
MTSQLDNMTGKWNRTFEPHFTFESDFYLDKKRSVEVLMMHYKFLTTPYIQDDDLPCSVVELKYTDNASALFILPDQGRMQQLEVSLQPESLRKWKDSLRPRKIDELYMPKFSISTDYSLENILPQLGIRKVFSSQADLSGITGAMVLGVSQVAHKAVLDVAETGMDGVLVYSNRPFLVIISDTNTQTPLFMAKVTNPKGN